MKECEKGLSQSQVVIENNANWCTTHTHTHTYTQAPSSPSVSMKLEILRYEAMLHLWIRGGMMA